MTKASRRVGIMLDLRWPYKRHADIYAGAQKYARVHGWDSIIDEFAHETLRRNKDAYDGIIARANLPLARRAQRLGLPLVNVWASSPARNLVPGVFPDATAVGRLVAEHLLARGFRRFGTLTAPKNVNEKLEVMEFARRVHDAGFPCVSAQIPQDPLRDLAYWRMSQRVITRWMDTWQPPIGVYVGEEMTGRMVVQACHQRGWRVPADVAIVAGKNEETLCEQPQPSLTSMEIGYERIGYEAARLLDAMMNGTKAPTGPIRVSPRSLIVRESTDFIAVDDEMVASALRFIAANSHRRIGPDNVADAVGAETRTLQNHFRKVLNRPVATEIRRVRLERATRELALSDRSLSAIARDVGFGEAIRMCEVFRRELGVTPSEYRKRQFTDQR